MLGLKLIHISESDPWSQDIFNTCENWFEISKQTTGIIMICFLCSMFMEDIFIIIIKWPMRNINIVVSTKSTYFPSNWENQPDKTDFSPTRLYNSLLTFQHILNWITTRDCS